MTATISLRLSEGSTRIGPSILAVVGYLGAFALLSQIPTTGMSAGVAYRLWAAADVALVAIIGAASLKNTLTPVQFSGIAPVTTGVPALDVAGHDLGDVPRRC
ncbi:MULTISPECIES: multidrug efflux SMR transporter [unclassified Saccharopolyspora]|uniref:DMT family transporter n=1 Tax=unclassified Saccharopolyspora TaxID=2646250 RepID=UPI001CD76651|nr:MULTISPECIES: SMR family transporter [unclassified Saccharopolyspora]MCA1186205.1 QacE family quaternary ammonium compound efflux SMR transporter [Saccharopolyspora sp. 6T]MCA1278408.1 QacE family quaternary ammonium compound efflux SMR transporter [Saccharopolyspora sp. 7B]